MSTTALNRQARHGRSLWTSLEIEGAMLHAGAPQRGPFSRHDMTTHLERDGIIEPTPFTTSLGASLYRTCADSRHPDAPLVWKALR